MSTQSSQNQMNHSSYHSQHHQSLQPQAYHNQQQQNQHVFLPPTSPAVQSRMGTSNAVPQSPIPYFAQSPGISGPTSNNPSIAQSPGFTNFGSPAIPHNSPSGAQQIISNTNPIQHTASVQSPSTGFMSPAPSSQQLQNYSLQSPANFSELSLPSPAPIKSPFVGPSPGNQNMQSGVSSNYGAGGHIAQVGSVGGGTSIGSIKQEYIDDQSKLTNQNQRSMNNPSGSTMSSIGFNSQIDALMINHHQYKKFHSASIPIYLSEAGFLKMISINGEHQYSPLEIFLASYHLKKILIKSIQNDTNLVIIKYFRINSFQTFLIVSLNLVPSKKL